uniref:RNase H type-1 domain-containing protein n=1 Tax=Vitis vinifera TaxID=29760 RepID=A5AUE9_VITVI|nr:hypothetical protein VITISV_025866 [Vitis vinifera]
MEVFGDSNLVLRQIQGHWKTRDVKLWPYHAYLELLVWRFDDLSNKHLPRTQNQFVDVLATLASMIDIPTDTIVHPLLIESRSVPAYCCLIDEAELDNGLPWYHDIYQFLRLDIYHEVATTKDKRALRQLYGAIIGKISPKSSNSHDFILVAIDYFTKWVEVASYARLASSGVASFIISHIIYRYKVPHELISDRGHHRSFAYRPQTNEAVEVGNKNIKKILRRMIETSRDWSKKFPFALWVYWTSFRTSTRVTPYSLVYGMEAVLPFEIKRRLMKGD